MITFSFSRRILSVVLAALLTFSSIPLPHYSHQKAYAATHTPTAQELHDMMGKLADPNISELDKKKITEVAFYNEKA